LPVDPDPLCEDEEYAVMSDRELKVTGGALLEGAGVGSVPGVEMFHTNITGRSEHVVL
jgi:hypothetical protein